MNSYDSILHKLNTFTRKYYTKLLIKGLLVFVTLGVLFFITVAGLEYFLWMGSNGRLALLLLFIAILLFLGYRYIAVPLFYLFRVKKGMSNREASNLIGQHFSEVDDRLVNLLDLADNDEKSDLLLAAVAQRSDEMGSIPFADAVNLKENLKYAKYVLIPMLLLGLIWVSGNIAAFFGSYKRVVNYDVAYEPPAPFKFQLLNTDLNLLEDETLTLEVITNGSIKPENMAIVLGGKELVMQKSEARFQYTFRPPLIPGSFYFTANGYDSRVYTLNVGNVPAIQQFEMELVYPKYLGKRNEIVRGTGNTTMPEGTEVTWRVRGVHTDEVDFITLDTLFRFEKQENDFTHMRSIYSDMTYELATSNKNVEHYETLGYQLKVVKDAYPTIKVQQTLDSLSPNTSYFSGLVSDDIQLRRVNMAYYPKGEKTNLKIVELLQTNANVEQFYYTFPSGIQLEEGKAYELYFEVYDNDGLRRGKSSKSQVFNTTVLDDNQLKNRELEAQQSILNNLDRSLENFKEQKEALKEINERQKENTNLNFNDKNQIKDFLQKQEQQESMMQKFSKQLKENLAKENEDSELNKLLQERLERQEKAAQKNKKLLEELNKIADKIDKEDLKKRLEELGKSQNNSERNLEQLLELTKRYYVTEKAAQLARDLEELAKKQNELSEQEVVKEDGVEQQEKLNKDYEKISKELDDLTKDNKALQKPLSLDVDTNKQKEVSKDQEGALEEIKKHDDQVSPEGKEKKTAPKTASKKQKSAAQKMEELSEGLKQSMASASGGGSSITEDAEMLRQILDNLITFSFKQENLFDQLQESDGEITQFSNTIRKQKELRGLFEHVDDSLFALSLRRAELSEFVNEQITEVYYNIDKSLERIAENQIYQGASYQQYVLTASNNLADFLAELLDNMQQSMQPGQGQGQGDGFQLPDIIKGQEELQEKMGQMGESGKQGEQGKEGQGSKGNEGKEGESGKKSGNGNAGEKGNGGESGENGNKGKGKSGENGGRKNGNGDGNEEGGHGNGPSEEELQEIYEIYKEQQVIRQKLEQQLKNIIEKDKQELAKKLVRQMESFENDLLENGVTQRTVNRMNTIQHQLLKLENAALKQGEKSERESKSNQESFRNLILTKPDLLKSKSNPVEILNRQALPLRRNYQSKVKSYFKNED